MSAERLAGIQGQMLSRLRHPAFAGDWTIDAELEGVVATSEDFRLLPQKPGLAELDRPLPCAHCQRPTLPPRSFHSGVGRPPKYCSNACRQAAYRMRRRAVADALEHSRA